MTLYFGWPLSTCQLTYQQCGSRFVSNNDPDLRCPLMIYWAHTLDALDIKYYTDQSSKPSCRTVRRARSGVSSTGQWSNGPRKTFGTGSPPPPKSASRWWTWSNGSRIWTNLYGRQHTRLSTLWLRTNASLTFREWKKFTMLCDDCQLANDVVKGPIPCWHSLVSGCWSWLEAGLQACQAFPLHSYICWVFGSKYNSPSVDRAQSCGAYMRTKRGWSVSL